MVTNEQLCIAVGVPMLFNALLFFALNARMSDFGNRLYETRRDLTETKNDLRSYMDQRFAAVDQRFTTMNTRFDDLKDTWRAELRRVEEVIDARLKHMEQSRH